MSDPIQMLAFIFIYLIFHEGGHVLFAKSQGIFKGVDVWYGSIRVNMTRSYNTKWDYLSGFMFGSLTLPLYIYWFNDVWFWALTLFLSLGDFIVIAIYDYVEKNSDQKHGGS